MRKLVILLTLILVGCGIKQEVASDANGIGNGNGNGGPTVEDAVFIREVVTNKNGTKVQCRLNPILLDVEEEIPVFIEFEGVEIQRAVFRNEKAPINFALFNPPQPGSLLCVIEFAGAEFESEPLFLEPQ